MPAGSVAFKTCTTHKATQECPWFCKPSSEAIKEREGLSTRSWNLRRLQTFCDILLSGHTRKQRVVGTLVCRSTETLNTYTCLCIAFLSYMWIEVEHRTHIRVSQKGRELQTQSVGADQACLKRLELLRTQHSTLRSHTHNHDLPKYHLVFEPSCEFTFIYPTLIGGPPPHIGKPTNGSGMLGINDVIHHMPFYQQAPHSSTDAPLSPPQHSILSTSPLILSASKPRITLFFISKPTVLTMQSIKYLPPLFLPSPLLTILHLPLRLYPLTLR